MSKMKQEGEMTRTRKPMMLGDIHRPLGKLQMKAIIDREEYYFFVTDERDIAMMPAKMIEDLIAALPDKEPK